VLPNADVLFICIETPSSDTGCPDLTPLRSVVDVLRKHQPNSPVLLALSSTVPVGTAEWMQVELGASYQVASCPDFVPEDSAIAEVFKPMHTVIGVDRLEVAERVASALGYQLGELVVTGWRDAEMIKYASNSLLAIKLSAANEIAAICEKLNVDGRQVLKVVGLDPRIGNSYMNVGIGYGGRLPTDMDALISIAGSVNVETPILKAAQRRNEAQRDDFLERVVNTVGSLVSRRIGIWGLSFKGGSGDLRESPALSIAQALGAIGATVQAYDPAQRHHAGELLGSTVPVVGDALSAAKGADVLLVLTDWNEFAIADWQPVAEVMKGRDVFDGRCCVDADALSSAGLVLHSVGTPSTHSAPESKMDVLLPVTVEIVPDGQNQTRPESETDGGNGLQSNGSISPLVDGRAFLAELPESIVAKAGPPDERPASTSRVYQFVKRAVDILVGLAVLTVAAPLFALIAIALAIETGRPVIFRADRVGKDGRHFQMYKFRTMHKETPKFAHKSTGNPWVTRVGRLLRLTNLDELPQAWNLLKGDMTIVGPRPEQPFITTWYRPWQAERLNVLPGITGWWQLYARGRDLMYQHIEYDVWYVRHRSLRLDVGIVLKTPFALLRARERR
jgi:UDPglucose 6-dehydrogenase